jgi:hypothetical protein
MRSEVIVIIKQNLIQFHLGLFQRQGHVLDAEHFVAINAAKFARQL